MKDFRGGESMGILIDITGQKFGRLTVIKQYGRSADNRITWLCQCECGNTKIVTGKALRRGETKSCGCYSKEIATLKNTKHGKRHTRLYRIWLMMKNRCNNPKEKFYHCYGGKGIKVCDEWSKDFMTFYNWSMEHGYNDSLTIDRVNVEKGYSPDNCRWTTLKEQANNKTNNHYITYAGKTQSMMKWAETLGIKYSTLRARINSYKWNIEKAFTTPIRGTEQENKP